MPTGRPSGVNPAGTEMAGRPVTLKFPETVDAGDYPKPRPFGGMGKPIDQDGYSDHFPIGMRVTEAD